jgi:hypothetical protein
VTCLQSADPDWEAVLNRPSQSREGEEQQAEEEERQQQQEGEGQGKKMWRLTHYSVEHGVKSVSGLGLGVYGLISQNPAVGLE